MSHPHFLQRHWLVYRQSNSVFHWASD
ncbi:hypothetical protein Gotri_027646 [Gossypium trilobum]|uniref:Uncharacterized protein n=1 Tax=Gossypium trilobum TaxID=34281 RepID=A0A7J9FH02_9ROSI|nr:hypothetical protein [Gossypium trilobum]